MIVIMLKYNDNMNYFNRMLTRGRGAACAFLRGGSGTGLHRWGETRPYDC